MLRPNITQLQLLLARLPSSTQDLNHLSFCAAPKAALVEEWANHLPLLQPHLVASTLYKALQEIVRLDLSFDERRRMLDIVNTVVNAVTPSLSQYYLNQPIILPEPALKSANLAQALQKYLNSGYWGCFKQLCERIEVSPELLQSTATQDQLLHLGHAIFKGIAAQMLRNFQLYLPVSGRLWQEAHTAFRLFRIFELLNISRDSTPLIHRYHKLLLLGCSRANQLRQHEITQCFHALDEFASLVKLESFDAINRKNLFVIITDGDKAPFYKSRLSQDVAKAHLPHLLELKTSDILPKLRAQEQHLRQDKSEQLAGRKIQSIPLSLSINTHLQKAWSHLSLRSFEREQRQSTLLITLGLSDIHYHLSNEQPFSVFLNKTEQVHHKTSEKNIFHSRHIELKSLDEQQQKKDPWDNAFSIKGTALDGKVRTTDNIENALKAHAGQQYTQSHPVHSLRIIDASLGGYGVEWRGIIPAQLKSGELVATRETMDLPWQIGVIRWVHQIKDGAQFGVQLLAPLAEPIAIAALQKTGNNSEYLRALRIPEMRAINQSKTLITNAISFHDLMKIKIFTPNQPVENAQLTQRIFSTGSTAQFLFKTMVPDAAPLSLESIDSTSITFTPNF